MPYVLFAALSRLWPHRHCQRMSVSLLRQMPPARRCSHGCPPTGMATSDHKCASPTEMYSQPHVPPTASSWSAFPEELLVPRLSHLPATKARCRRRLRALMVATHACASSLATRATWQMTSLPCVHLRSMCSSSTLG